MDGRFGHHPDPACDFCIEVETLEGMLFDAKHGIAADVGGPPLAVPDVLARIRRAMDFRVGGDPIAVQAKAVLRRLEDDAIEHARAAAQDAPTSAAVRDVLAERARQVNEEGFTPERDDLYVDGELAAAAACYAITGGKWQSKAMTLLTILWPWSRDWLKPTTPRRDLVKSAALTLSEIERLDRKEAREAKP